MDAVNYVKLHHPNKKRTKGTPLRIAYVTSFGHDISNCYASCQFVSIYSILYDKEQGVYIA